MNGRIDSTQILHAEWFNLVGNSMIKEHQSPVQKHKLNEKLEQCSPNRFINELARAALFHSTKALHL